MICLGSKSYSKINISSIIDTFEPIRHNFQLPNNNNGTKYGTYIFCNHVWVWKDKNIKDVIKKYGEKSFSKVSNEHLIRWKLSLVNNKINKYKKQFSSNHWRIFNEYLKNIKSPYLFLILLKKPLPSTLNLEFCLMISLYSITIFSPVG